MKFAVALGKSPGHGPDNTRRAYNFLPKHTTEYDLNSIEKKIIHKLEDRCEVRAKHDAHTPQQRYRENYRYPTPNPNICDQGRTVQAEPYRAGGIINNIVRSIWL